MDWTSKTPSEWDWENLCMSSGRTIEIPKHVQLSSHEIEGEGAGNEFLYSSADSSLKEGVETFSTVDGLPIDCCQKVVFSENFPALGDSISSGGPMIGLKLGRRTYFEDMCAAGSSKTAAPTSIIPTSSAATARSSRVSNHGAQAPHCQVEGCHLDLKSAKEYHRRHRICESHSKSPRVVVAGVERRFHKLSEFDDKKRSCRRRLSDHNARRRRPRQEAIQFNSMRASSLNGFPLPFHPAHGKMVATLRLKQSRDSLSRPAKHAGMYRETYLSSDKLPNYSSMECLDSEIYSFQSSTPRVLNHDLAPSAGRCNLDVASDLRHAHSLLSTNSWGSNEPEPTSLGQFIQVNQRSGSQPMIHAEPQNAALASSQHMRLEEPTAVSRLHSLDLHSNGNNQFQEFQFFKTPYESGCFYTNQIN
ncbi:hypothetical protein RHSIM_Rhsim01G0105700 [Rhododendron simsii]|uniref:SBP-type domain-containing protein n=1 Tax=Rhododendron simsii TaxID=118357 RepID=A0A834HHK9_RHOSS|nr:hypothetical protein RHSIM_Rhsim01G0105700 [Rhododendron simsii]